MRALIVSTFGTLLFLTHAMADAGLVPGEILFNDAERLRHFKPRDQFQSPPDLSPLVGRSFKADLPLDVHGPATICVGIPYATYDAHVGLTIHYGDAILDPDAGMRSQFSLGCSITKHLERQANGFGAVIPVTVEDQTFSAIEATNLSPTLWGHDYTLKVFGNDARSLSRAINVRVEGKIESEEGQPIECHNNSLPASIDHPTQFKWHGCHISAKITALSIVVNTSEGQIIRALNLPVDAPK